MSGGLVGVVVGGSGVLVGVGVGVQVGIGVSVGVGVTVGVWVGVLVGVAVGVTVSTKGNAATAPFSRTLSMRSSDALSSYWD